MTLLGRCSNVPIWHNLKKSLLCANLAQLNNRKKSQNLPPVIAKKYRLSF
jgi:hypothetical protein